MRRTAFAKGWLLLPFLLLVLPGSVRAQGIDELEDLESLDEEVVTEKVFQAGIDVDKWELTVQIGFMQVPKPIFRAEQILVKWNSKGKLFADMQIDGNSSFSPQVRIGRNWGHLGWQATLGMTMGDFRQNIDAASVVEHSFSGKPGEVVLEENDPEIGSLVTWYHEQALVYNILVRGHLIPYVLGGIGAQYWVIDSAYLKSSDPALTFSFGGGLRVVADDLFSVVFEVRDYMSKVQHNSSSTFLTDQVDPDDDTRLIDIPLTQLDSEDTEIPFGGFAEESYHAIWFSIGLIASF